MARSFRKFVARLDKIGLRQALEGRALKLHVSLQDLYEGPGRAPSITAARRDVYLWLDRAPSGVLKLTQKNGMRKSRGRIKP